MQYFEDLEIGDVAAFGEYNVTEAEIVAFAEQYDPQPFHTDPDRAHEESIYGGLIASGWHTTAMTMRLLVDGFLDDIAAHGAKGIDHLRFPRPVTPGDVLSVRTEVLEKTIETDTRGLVRVQVETLDDRGETVCSMIGLLMVERRGD